MDGIENNNDDFSGFLETDVSDIDFFSVEAEETPEEEKTKQKQQEETELEQEEAELEDSEDLFTPQEDDLEEAEEEEEENELEEEKEGTKDQSLGDSKVTLNLLKEKGLIEYELEEGEDLTDEKAEEILEDSLDNLFEDRIEELFSDVPDIVKEMNKFVLKGGDINVFLDTISRQSIDGLKPEMDLEDEKNQELVIKHSLREEGYDEEYITAQIEFLKDSKRMKKYSETHFKKWDEKRVKAQEAVLKSQEAKVKAEKEQRKELKNKVSTFLSQTDEVTGFSVSNQDKKILPNYMSDRTVKLDNGAQITGMQRDLMRVLNSPTGSVQIAKLLRAASESGELSFEDIKKETETKVAKKVRENVRRNKKSIITQSGAKNKKIRLADYFN